MPKLVIIAFLAACAAPTWQSAGDLCTLRGDTACQASAHEVEMKLEKDWHALASSFVPRGVIIYSADIDSKGMLRQVQVVDGSAGVEVERHARVLLQEKAPYPASANRRVYVRFAFQPAAVSSLAPPLGDDEKLRAMVAQLQPKFRECFQMAIAENGDFFFKGALLFEVAETGALENARLEGEKQVVDFRKCVLDELQALKLPAWEYTGKRVRYPLQFEVRIKRGKS